MDFEKYSQIVDRLGSKFRLDYSTERKRVLLLLRSDELSKVEGMILGGIDFIILCDWFKDGSCGSGFEVRGRLCDADEDEMKRVIETARNGKFYGDAKLERVAKRDVKKDIYSLRNLERNLYYSGLVLPQSRAILETF